MRLFNSILLWVFRLALIALLAVALRELVGSVTIKWNPIGPFSGGEVHLSLLFSLGVLLLFVLLCVWLYSSYKGLIRLPGFLSEKRKAQKREKGYQALSLGMVAASAGDSHEAGRRAGEAKRLMEKVPLTLLLQAQSAQLQGDERAAERYFIEMVEDPETRLMGLRGLANQALAAGQPEEARKYAEAARKLAPNAPWVLDMLFQLDARLGAPEEAAKIAQTQQRNKQIASDEARHRQAIMMLDASRRSLEARNYQQASQQARKSLALSPERVPEAIQARLLLIKSLLADEKPRAAVSQIEKAWSQSPEAGLVSDYIKARQMVFGRPLSGEGRQKAVERLVSHNPQHPLSLILLAELAIDRREFDDAKALLNRSLEQGPNARSYHLLANIEQRMGNDPDLVRENLTRALIAGGEEGQWECKNCREASADWRAVCPNCEAVDSLFWHRPPELSGKALGPEGSAPRLLPALVEG